MHSCTNHSRKENDVSDRREIIDYSIDPVFAPSALIMPQEEDGPLDTEKAFVSPLAHMGKVSRKPHVAAIILAGGYGHRFGRDTGKQLVKIVGCPMLSWSIAAFDAVDDVGLIVVVCPEDRMQEYWAQAVDPYSFATPIAMAVAGDTRQESAFNGLEATPSEYEFVALHDGARPLIAPELINHTINMLKGTIDAEGAIVATPAIDTLKVVSSDNVIVGTPDRKAFWNAQTPQVFRSNIYRRAHASALRDGFIGTDDSALIERLGGKVLVVKGTRDNIKLTVPEDYAVLSAVVEKSSRSKHEGE
jgi:2-C-methyl-D-erythritol 4-phosphate cytidylyltransferase